MPDSGELLEPLGGLRRPLEAVGELLAASGEEHRLLVVGGVAVLLRGIRSRATTDVDVIARVEVDDGGAPRLLPPSPLPETLAEAVSRVARDFELSADWLNAVVGAQWQMGEESLPPGLLEDTTWHRLGGLHLGVAGRRTLMALKLYAATDSGPGSVHTQDLLAMRPTRAELAESAEWASGQDPSPAFQSELRRAMAALEARLDHD